MSTINQRTLLEDLESLRDKIYDLWNAHMIGTDATGYIAALDEVIDLLKRDPGVGWYTISRSAEDRMRKLCDVHKYEMKTILDECSRLANENLRLRSLLNIPEDVKL